MNKLKTKYLLLLLSCILFFVFLPNGQVSAQTGGKSSNKEFFDKSKWEKNTGEADYTENIKERKKKDKSKEKEQKKKKESQPIKFRKAGNASGFAKVLLVVIIIGVLSFLIFLILRNTFNVFAEKVPNTKLESIVDNLEDNLHNADFENLLQQAIDDGKFKLAVRIFYLHLIKVLSDKELIKWKKEKTNGHYVREMFQNPNGRKFSWLTVIYEQAWFGPNKIEAENYHRISKEFTEFLTEID